MRSSGRTNYYLGLMVLLLAIVADQLTAANMRSFIESVRRKAPVVYVGSVRNVKLLARTRFDLKARATIEVLAVLRSAGPNPREATVEYSSYDEKAPMLAGGPQYQLRPRDMVVVFADSFSSTIPPGYLLHGSRDELLQRVIAVRDGLRQMSPDQLKVNEITEDDRQVQLGLYEKLCASLH